jgi:hypothetical protein
MSDAPALKALTREGADVTSVLTPAEAFKMIAEITTSEQLTLVEAETDRMCAAADQAWAALETKAIQYLGGFAIIAALVGATTSPEGGGWAAIASRAALAGFGVAGVVAVIAAVRALSVRTLTTVNPATILGNPMKGAAFSPEAYRRYVLKARWEALLWQLAVHGGKARAVRAAEVALCISVASLGLAIIARVAAG